MNEAVAEQRTLVGIAEKLAGTSNRVRDINKQVSASSRSRLSIL